MKHVCPVALLSISVFRNSVIKSMASAPDILIRNPCCLFLLSSSLSQNFIIRYRSNFSNTSLKELSMLISLYFLAFFLSPFSSISSTLAILKVFGNVFFSKLLLNAFVFAFSTTGEQHPNISILFPSNPEHYLFFISSLKSITSKSCTI